jgi:hypothetical protein
MMAEPAASTALTIAAAAASVKMLTVAGIPLGLRPDILLAGFCGALVAVILLNTVPSGGDTWRALLATTVKRFFVVLASSLTAGYLAPVIAGAAEQSSLLFVSFVVGAGAQQVLVAAIARISARADLPSPPPTGGKP